MAKYNIKFNNADYQIDESALADATAALRTHLSTTMNGTGATIELGGTTYNIDSTKLSTATNDFVTHLGTISGNGLKVVIGGVEYGVDANKVSGAVSELEAAWGGLNNPDAPTPEEERLGGDGAEFYTLAPTALSFRSTAPLNELQEVQINGVTVDPSNYTLEEGSTIVTFPIEYLKTLNVGNYEVTVASDSKSAKGNFTVAAPELNEHGFYYNQPYTAFVDYFQANTVFFIRENGTIDVWIDDVIETCPYTIDGNSMTVATSGMGDVHLTVSTDGIECIELATNFVLGDEFAAADNDYIYIYKEELGGYEVKTIDSTRDSYGVIKTNIYGYNIVSLSKRAFNGCNSLTSITIPNTVTFIGEYAFNACHSLTSITIPNSVTSIDSKAFNGCNSLTSITIPNSVTNIGNGVFGACHSLTSITIPNSVTNIGSEAFYDCRSLTSITIPNSVTNIGNGAFYGCSSITSITIPDSVTSIGNGAFGRCYSLADITIPFVGVNKNETNVYARQFGYIFGKNSEYYDIPASLKTVVITGGEKIVTNAFDSCKNILNITIPNSVTSIGKAAFNGCSSLRSIIFNGTTAQWNAITKDDNIVGDNVAYVQCSDGQVAL